MSRLPIRLRLTLAFALVMGVVLAVLGVFLYARVQANLNERIADNLERRSEALVAVLRERGGEGLEPSLLAGEDELAQVFGPGCVDQPRETVDLRGGLTAAEVAAARTGPVTAERSGLRLRAVAIDECIVVVGESIEDRDEALDALLTQLAVALPIALLLSSAIGYLGAGAALRPVEAMRRRAADITSDSAERRLPLPRAHDEIHRLGETLNEMLERLDAGLARERRFVADASHELRTPLASLRTELELAVRRPRTQEELEGALRSASEEVERLVRLAEDLLVLARADDGQLPLRVEEHSAAALLDAVASRNEARATTAGRSLLAAAPPELTLSGDRRRLEQALDVLVDNALRHGAGTVRMDARAENGFVRLSVSDEGRGFPPEFLPHAFERFSRTDPARTGGGAGLGLAIVDAIARAHGGSAHAANLAPRGVDVWLALPSRLNDGDASG